MASSSVSGKGKAWRAPTLLFALVTGCLITFPAANVLPLLVLLVHSPNPLSIIAIAFAEAAFLTAFLWWCAGGGPPRAYRSARKAAIRNLVLSRGQWTWAIFGALAFATAVHAMMILLFRLVPFPLEAFRANYAFISRLPSQGLKWIAIMIAAASAAITEETGFRGYMQQPLERRYGIAVAILVCATAFAIGHLNQAWAVPGMLGVALFAGILLGTMAWASGSLIPGIVGHFVMDVGLFAYWWTGTAGTFRARTIAETGIDRAFLLVFAVFVAALLCVFVAVRQLALLRRRMLPRPSHG